MMILRYQFDYALKNGAIPYFLDSICKDEKVKYSLLQEDDKVLLYVSEEEEKQIYFSNLLSNKVPLSIFLNSTKVEVVDDFPISKQVFVNKQVNLFNVQDIKDDIDSIFDTFLKNGKVIIKATNEASYKLSKIDENSKNKKDVLISDLSNAQKIGILEEDEVASLATIEKPFIKCNVTQMSKYKEFLPCRIRIKMAHESLLQNFAKKLYENKIEAVFIENLEENIEDLEVVVLRNQKLIVKGDVYTPLNNPYIKDRTTSSLKAYEIVLAENDKINSKSACFYASKKNDDNILISSNNKIVTFLAIDMEFDFESIFALIRRSDANGNRLVKRYMEQNKKLYNKLCSYKIDNPKNNIYTLWGICGMILDFSDDISSSCEKILDNIHLYSQDKAPLVDYKMINKASRYELDFVKVIKSIMSYELAGADDIILSWALVQSFVDFISTQADFIKESYMIENFILCGEVFGEKRIINDAIKKLIPNHNILLNKVYAIDNLDVPLSQMRDR